jgi:hypothetical protein
MKRAAGSLPRRVVDPVELFFLQIQGSGQVELESGERMRLGSADQTAIPTARWAATLPCSLPTASATPITPEWLMQFTFGFAPPLIIEAAIRHQVDEGAKTVDTLCAENADIPTGLTGHPERTRRA